MLRHRARGMLCPVIRQKTYERVRLGITTDAPPDRTGYCVRLGHDTLDWEHLNWTTWRAMKTAVDPVIPV
jgi:hypothetical protein